MSSRCSRATHHQHGAARLMGDALADAAEEARRPFSPRLPTTIEVGVLGQRL